MTSSLGLNGTDLAEPQEPHWSGTPSEPITLTEASIEPPLEFRIDTILAKLQTNIARADHRQTLAAIGELQALAPTLVMNEIQFLAAEAHLALGNLAAAERALQQLLSLPNKSPAIENGARNLMLEIAKRRT